MFSLKTFSSMFKKSSINRGFSMVEILIVIAIIGILAGIVLVAMNPARKQGKESRIISDLVQLQNEAEILYLEEGDYSNVNCLTDSPEIAAICDDVAGQGGEVNIHRSMPSDRAYCAFSYFDFPSSMKGFCVDAAGFSDKLSLPGLSCDYNPFCEYRDCPDFNNNGVVDCSNDSFNPECPDPPPATPPCGVDFPWTTDGSDVCCVTKCVFLQLGDIPADCGTGLCPPSSTLGTSCAEMPNGDELCLEIYDINDDGTVDLFNDIMGVVNLIDTKCD